MCDNHISSHYKTSIFVHTKGVVSIHIRRGGECVRNSSPDVWVNKLYTTCNYAHTSEDCSGSTGLCFFI